MNFYSLYSKSQRRFNVPFLATNDDEAISRVSQMVTSANDPALILSLSDLELHIIGFFDPMSICPIVDFDDRGKLILGDLHDKLPLPPLVRDKVDKLYGLTVEGGASDV